MKEITFLGDRSMITQAAAQKVKGAERLHTILRHGLIARSVIRAELFDENHLEWLYKLLPKGEVEQEARAN